MAISNILSGYAFLNDGTAIAGANVDYYAAVAGIPSSSLGSTTTDANGYWTFTVTTAQQFDVRIRWNSNTQVRWIKGLSVIGFDICTYQVAVLALTNDTLVATDNIITVNASEKWVFNGILFFTAGNATDDVKIAVNTPASPTTLNWASMGDSTTPGTYSAVTLSVDGTSQAKGFEAGVSTAVPIAGFLHNGANAGTVTIEVAKNGDASTDGELGIGSWVRWRRVA